MFYITYKKRDAPRIPTQGVHTLKTHHETTNLPLRRCKGITIFLLLQILRAKSLPA